MVPSIAEDLGFSVSDAFAAFAHEQGLRLVAQEFDRHGSLEWSASRGSRPAYILALDLTPARTRSERLRFDAEIWGMIDTGTHYLRKRLGAWTIARSTTPAVLGDRLKECWHQLLTIMPDEARTPYDIPHTADPRDLIHYAAPADGAPGSPEDSPGSVTGKRRTGS